MVIAELIFHKLKKSHIWLCLDSLINLQWLEINKNKITELKGLDSLTKLIKLTLHDNQIEHFMIIK
ncbi:MAG: leucine-rich repeat domain-containing protein [Promethearchaeota archaeon]